MDIGFTINSTIEYIGSYASNVGLENALSFGYYSSNGNFTSVYDILLNTPYGSNNNTST